MKNRPVAGIMVPFLEVQILTYPVLVSTFTDIVCIENVTILLLLSYSFTASPVRHLVLASQPSQTRKSIINIVIDIIIAFTFSKKRGNPLPRKQVSLMILNRQGNRLNQQLQNMAAILYIVTMISLP